MKPCSRNRKLIAWLALGGADARKGAALQDHLAGCEGCSGYLKEMSKLAEELRAATAPACELQASPSFHARVAKKLQALESPPVLETLAAGMGRLIVSRRWVGPAIAVLVLAVGVWLATQRNSNVSLEIPHQAQIVLPSNPGTDLAPTIANYQRIANDSLEKFDDLLTRQGNKSLPAAPLYTVSGFEALTSSF